MFRHFEDVRQWCIVISLGNFALWSSYYSVFFCWFVHSFAVMAALKIFLYYNLLEEVKRVAESAQRTRVNLCGHSHFKIPSHPRGLSNASQSHRTKLLFLPSGMSKREKNKSEYNQRDKCIT
ncbi:uncharacterized protein LOC132252638 isoform X2 [Vitis vinifera]|uniref:uncharacterized protein LOC132252638 isoform X2 n=1 Tax=Vitis vinifera TaxID=29760 RepID=UPI002882EEC3|nr:uncharacterized protein LOC132252638 isoform X2 [Vitis vinifera]